jgi:outer membrane protein TolC
MRIYHFLYALPLGMALTGAPSELRTQPPMPARPLRLAEALAEADDRAFANRRATAAAEAERARAALPLKGILPGARLESGFVRTTDPIGAFGTTLRQRLVSPAAFDPVRLNFPAPVNNVMGGVALDMPLLNGDAWAGWRAARSAADATDAVADWTRLTTRAQVVAGYYGTILATEKVTTLEQADRAAQAAVRQVERMVQQGLVTKADALLAQVRAGDVTAQLLAARHDATSAQQQLAMLLGRTTSSSVVLPGAMPNDDAIRALAAVDTGALPATSRSAEIGQRDDVRAARLAAQAARADLQRAGTTMLPRVNGFARYDWNSPATLYAGRPNWTVGVMASWSLFGGGSEVADVVGAAARARSARAGAEGAEAQAQVEIDVTARVLAVALQRLDLAATSAAQSREAHRLVEKRYVGGLATIAELLGAEATATGAALAHAAARYAVIDAVAQHRRAIGADPGAIARLDTDASSLSMSGALR